MKRFDGIKFFFRSYFLQKVDSILISFSYIGLKAVLLVRRLAAFIQLFEVYFFKSDYHIIDLMPQS